MEHSFATPITTVLRDVAVPGIAAKPLLICLKHVGEQELYHLKPNEMFMNGYNMFVFTLPVLLMFLFGWLLII